MKICLTVSFILGGLLLATPSHAQVSVYGTFTASDLQGGPQGNYLYGETAGLLAGRPLGSHLVLSADVQERYVDKGGERLTGVTLGSRLSVPLKKLKLTPYGEFLFGFARYRDGSGANDLNTTDSLWGTSMGVSRPIAPHLDVLFDYGYAQYGVANGKYNPKSYSLGVLYRFKKL